MAGEHIALLHLLHLQNALKATVTSKEFIDLKVFKNASEIVMMDDFWAYLFLLCRALYAPMHVLCVADQKKNCHGQVVLLHAADRYHAT